MEKVAVIYCRVSTDMQAQQGTSLETQELACLRLAQEMGVRVLDVIRDEGVSGAAYYSREGIQKALNYIESSAASILIVAKLDRAGRSVYGLSDIRQRVILANGELVFADGMNFANNATGDLIFTQLSAITAFERAAIFERTMLGRTRKASGNEQVRGEQVQRARQPYGYTIPCKNDVLQGTYTKDQLGTYLLREDQARYARYIFESFAAGKSLHSICKHLMQQGVPSPSGGVNWWPESISKMITNPVYKGVGTYGRRRRRTILDARTASGKRKQDMQYVPESDWITFSAPALVTADVWNQCQQRLADNKQRLGGNPDRCYLLSGMLVCQCGGKTSGVKNKVASGERRYYRCNLQNRGGCKEKQIRMDLADGLVINGLIAASRQPLLFRDAIDAYDQHRAACVSIAENDAEYKRLQNELDALKAQEQATVQAQIQGIAAGASVDAYNAAFKALADKRKMLETRLAAITPQARQSVVPAKDHAAKLESVLRDVEHALTSPDVTIAEKHNLVSLVVRQIVPAQDALTIYFRETINDMSISSAVSNPFWLVSRSGLYGGNLYAETKIPS